MNLEKLLRPKSVAVIGASDKPGFGLSTCENLIRSHRQEDIFFVHPKRESVLGKKCYKSIADLPQQVDMCIILLNKSLVISTLEQAAACGCKAAIVYASGYGETGDKEAEKELRETAERLDMAVMGVNCAGYISNNDDLFPFGMIVKRDARPGNIAIISQSGKICLNMMQVDYMNFSYLISAGNCSCIMVEDYISYLIDDPGTKVIGLYLEGVKDPEKFADVLRRAAEIRKPIVILKVGRSEAGSRVASSHTGSLSGSDKAFDALCRKFGIIRVDDIEELVQMCHMLSVMPELPAIPTISAMCLSGGETGVCADVGTLNGLEYPAFTEETLAKLTELLPDYASPANPLDMTATLSHDGPKYAEVIKAIMQDPNVGMVLCGQTVLPHQSEEDVIYPMSDGMVIAANERIKPVAVINFFNCDRDPVIRAKLEKAGVALLPAPGTAFKLLRHLMDMVKYKPEEKTLTLAVPHPAANGRVALSEYDSKMELQDFGVKVPYSEVVKSEEQLERVCCEVSYPCVAKIESADILHKSDIGGVKLNLNNAMELREAYREVLKNAAERAPEAKINGVLVQPMLPKGVEVILGVNVDPQFGPMVLCGLGGVFVEVFKDVALYPAPLNKGEAMDMLRSLKGYKMLTGYRGGEKCDVDALADLMVQVSEYAVANRDTLCEMDLNPVFVYGEGKGVEIADAVIIKRN
ncbi:MAG TPA: acetate--CoA ligase family protein [Candidatus Scatomorpha gallistercoris]|nr:acetate--CoA ligase family protein [Candidatus Scatomorpha gallistercoris]